MNYRVLFFLCCFLTTCGKDSSVLQRAPTPADAAVLNVNPSFVFNFPSLKVPGSETQTFAVSNTGAKPATGIQGDFGLSVTFVYPGGYPGTGGDCAASLAAGASCNLVVQFSPQVAGSFSQALILNYNNGYSVVSTQYPTLNGTGF